MIQKFKYFFITKAFYGKDKNSLAEGSLTSRPKHISVHFKQGKVKIFQLSGSLYLSNGTDKVGILWLLKDNFPEFSIKTYVVGTH